MAKQMAGKSKKIVVAETRLEGYSVRKTAEITGIPYAKVLKILASTQIDDVDGK